MSPVGVRTSLGAHLALVLFNLLYFFLYKSVLPKYMCVHTVMPGALAGQKRE